MSARVAAKMTLRAPRACWACWAKRRACSNCARPSALRRPTLTRPRSRVDRASNSRTERSAGASVADGAARSSREGSGDAPAVAAGVSGRGSASGGGTPARRGAGGRGAPGVTPGTGVSGTDAAAGNGSSGGVNTRAGGAGTSRGGAEGMLAARGRTHPTPAKTTVTLTVTIATPRPKTSRFIAFGSRMGQVLFDLGSRTRNVVPRPGVLCTSTSPSWSCTMRYTIESPIPVP